MANDIKHYGVKGMRWGVRKDKGGSGESRVKAAGDKIKGVLKQTITEIKSQPNFKRDMAIGAVGVSLWIGAAVADKAISRAEAKQTAAIINQFAPKGGVNAMPSLEQLMRDY